MNSTLQFILQVILPLIAGIILTGPLKKVRNFIYSKIQIFWNNFSFNKKIDDYFHISHGFNSIDLVAYQFGLRPNLPIIDILYLELLKKFIILKKIKKIVIFPTIDKSSQGQSIIDFELFKKNINSVFCKNKNHIIISDPFKRSEIDYNDLINDNYIDSLNYLCSKEFINEVLITSGQRITGIEDFNKFHPKERSIMTLFTHIYKAWEVREYVLNYISESKMSTNNIGFIFWEVEFDKWGIYSRTAKENTINELALFIGKSLYDKKMKPIPVFTNEALGIFDDCSIIFEKVTKHSKIQVSTLIEIITAILKDNYNEEILSKKALLAESTKVINSLFSSNKSFGAIFSIVKNQLSNNERILFVLLIKLRSKYGC